jgi:hypothetical protein
VTAPEARDGARAPGDVLADDLRAAAAARAELGGDYDGAVLRSLAERLGTALDAPGPRRRGGLAARDVVTVVVALGSVGLGVLVAAAAGDLGEAGATLATVVAWIAIAVINVAHARAR